MTTPTAAATTTAAIATAAASTTLQLPEIDFHGYRFGNAEQRAAVCSQIAEACSTYGFFYLTHHGVSSEAIASAFEAAQSFFAQPVEKRLACRSRYNNQNRGYQPLLDTQHPGKPPDVKESFDMGFPLAEDDADMLAGLPFHAPNSWPDENDSSNALRGFRGATENLYFSMLETGRDVLRAMAEALQADRNFFVKD
ncbi:MAG: 2-oxoglutarate and iron-dependent oxygenase domain-containing protein, partial [Burkholderiaceae bacterium]